MAYTIIDVERQTGIPSRTLRFWVSKGLFPYLERDKNNVAYFSARDVEWVRWINWLRISEMSIENIRKYVLLAHKGNATAKERQSMLHTQRQIVLDKVANLHAALEKLDYKIGVYDKLLEEGLDAMNPQSKDYIPCKQIHTTKRGKATQKANATQAKKQSLKQKQPQEQYIES